MTTARAPRGARVFSVTYIGDLALATLTFDIIARRVGGPLAVVTSPAAAPLLAADPRVARIDLVRSSKALVWRIEVARHVLAARRAGDEVVNLEVYPPRWRFLRAACRWAGVPARHIDLPGLVADNRRSASGEATALPHRADYYARAAHLVEGDPPLPRLAIDPRATETVDRRLRTLALPEGLRTVVVHAGSSEAARRLPAPLCAALLTRAAARIPLAVVLVGTAPERPLGEALARALAGGPRVVDWTGGLGVTELAALIHAADVFVGGDSGPLKVAEAVGARTLSLWGPTGAGFAGPRGPAHRMLRFDSTAEEGAAALVDLLGA